MSEASYLITMLRSSAANTTDSPKPVDHGRSSSKASFKAASIRKPTSVSLLEELIYGIKHNLATLA